VHTNSRCHHFRTSAMCSPSYLAHHNDTDRRNTTVFCTTRACPTHHCSPRHSRTNEVGTFQSQSPRPLCSETSLVHHDCYKSRRKKQYTSSRAYPSSRLHRASLQHKFPHHFARVYLHSQGTYASAGHLGRKYSPLVSHLDIHAALGTQQ